MLIKTSEEEKRDPATEAQELRNGTAQETPGVVGSGRMGGGGGRYNGLMGLRPWERRASVMNHGFVGFT